MVATAGNSYNTYAYVTGFGKNVHSSHIRFFSFKDSENLIGTV